jgi:hypothetical protein
MYLAGGLVLVCVGMTMLAQEQVGRTELIQQLKTNAPLSRQEQIALTLMSKGQNMMSTAQQEIKMGQQMLAAAGLHAVPSSGSQQLAAGVNCSETPCIGLEENGVNVDMWPQNHEITRLPGYTPPVAPNESDYNTSLDSIEQDYDFYNRQPLLKAGVKIGHWFWESDDIDETYNATAPPSPDEIAADEELDDIVKKMQNATSPEERLSKAGIKVEGMPWDPEYVEEPEEPAEDADEEAAAKSAPMALKMRKQMQLKQLNYGSQQKVRNSLYAYEGLSSQRPCVQTIHTSMHTDKHAFARTHIRVHTHVTDKCIMYTNTCRNHPRMHIPIPPLFSFSLRFHVSLAAAT